MAATLSDLATLRSATYRFYGTLFLHPTSDRLADLTATTDELLSENDLARSFAYDGSYQAIRASVAELTESSQHALVADHVRLLRVGGPHRSCPPYESEFVDPTRREHGSVAVELERLYAEAGMGLTLSRPGELPDHVASELEFMSLLCAEEQHHWEAGRSGEASRYLAREKSFLDDHLTRWIPAFSRCLRSAGETSFYSQLSEATKAFIVHDKDLVDVLLQDVREAVTRESRAQATGDV